ncbi:protein of unknown function [Streptomyces sp. KY75]|nr:protein of unknown function [Streptomyces sp. KY75]
MHTLECIKGRESSVSGHLAE